VVKEPTRLDGATLQAKRIIHHQDHIQIVRIRCGGNIATKNNESPKVARALSQVVNMGQTLGTYTS
jgi:hypothetical protein